MGSGVPISMETRHEIIRLHKEGKTKKQIVAATGVSRGSVDIYLRLGPQPERQGNHVNKSPRSDTMRGQGIVLPVEKQEQIIQMRKDGFSFAQISRILRISPRTAQNYVRKGVTDPVVLEQRKEEKEIPLERLLTVETLYCQGITWQSICRRLQLSTQEVQYCIQKVMQRLEQWEGIVNRFKQLNHERRVGRMNVAAHRTNNEIFSGGTG